MVKKVVTKSGKKEDKMPMKNGMPSKGKGQKGC